MSDPKTETTTQLNMAEISRDNTLSIAADILKSVLEAKSLTLAPDAKVRSNTAENDAAQIARAFVVIHDAVYNEHKRTNARN